MNLGYRSIAHQAPVEVRCSPSPSEAEALSKKTKTKLINLKQYFNREYWKSSKNISASYPSAVTTGLRSLIDDGRRPTQPPFSLHLLL